MLLMKNNFYSLMICIVLSVYADLLFASMFTDPGEGQSYAQEYNKLRQLLENVTSTEMAIKHKKAIEQQINVLRKNQLSGEDNFNAMSQEEKKFFIKKFQNNRFHCGEVTQVMTEKQRILLDSSLAEILAETLSNIP